MKGLVFTCCWIRVPLLMPAVEASDAEVVRHLVMSTQYIDDVDGARQEARYARSLCGEDTNRFARILCELSTTGGVRVARSMIKRLAFHGTSAQLPFLYSQTTNTLHGADAVKSILAIEGVTSNSVAVVDSYLSMTNMTNRNRYYACSELIDKNSSSSVADGVREAASRVYLRFMSESNIYHDWLDVKLKSADPSYGFSKRRLSVMRAVRARVNDPADMNFVTNAINELVAYPEADLPE